MNQMGIPAGLQAVLNAANAIKPVSSTGQPTVAAQVMGAAEQAGMSDATAASRASLGPANQRLEDERMQDILQRLNQSRPAGIEGLPTGDTLQGFAEGGVVGFAGEEGSYVGAEFGGSTPEALAADVLRVEENKRRRRMEELQTQLEFLAQAGAPQAERVRSEIAALSGSAPAKQAAAPAPAKQAAAPAPRPGTGRPAAALAPAATGIAALTDYDKKAEATLEELAKRLNEPFARKAPTLEEMQAQTDKARQARGLMGAPGAHMSEQIAAFKELIAQQEAERSAGAKGRNLADLAAILSAGGRGGLRSVGEKYAQVSQVRSDEAERLRAQQLAQKQAVFTMQNAQVAMQEAAANGDMVSYRAAQKDFNDAERAYETAKTTGIVALAKERGEIANRMFERPLKERELGVRERTARAAEAQAGEARGTRMLSLAGLEQNRLAAALDRVDKAHKEDPRYKNIYILSSMGIDQLTPAQQKQYREAEEARLRERSRVEANFAPTLDRLYQDLGLSRGASTNVQRYDASGNRITGG